MGNYERPEVEFWLIGKTGKIEMIMDPKSYVDLKGRMFGQLQVTGDAGLDKYDIRLWRCNCSCGKNGIKIEEHRLLESFIDRCDICMMKHYATFNIPMRAGCKSIHAALQDTCYETWYNTIRRYLCYSRDPENKPIKDRISGISPQWKRFENFYKDMHPRKPGTELSRIDKDGEFSKENCRWMTRAQSMVGRRVGQGSLVRPESMVQVSKVVAAPVVEKQQSIAPVTNHEFIHPFAASAESIERMRAEANAEIEVGSRMHREAAKKIEEARARLRELVEIEDSLGIVTSFRRKK
jgi:hypothetical protein